MATDCDVCRGAHCEAIEQSASDDKRYGLEFLKRVTITINTNVKLNSLKCAAVPLSPCDAATPRRLPFPSSSSTSTCDAVRAPPSWCAILAAVYLIVRQPIALSGMDVAES